MLKRVPRGTDLDPGRCDHGSPQLQPRLQVSSENAIFGKMCFPLQPQHCLATRDPQGTPRDAQGAPQGTPKGVPNGSKGSQGVPKGAKGGPKGAQRIPRGSQEGTKGYPVAPQGNQRVPRESQKILKRVPSGLEKCASRCSHSIIWRPGILK